MAEQGGLGFIAHPIGEDYPTRAMACPWLDWNVQNFTGIELWSYMHDWARNVNWATLPKALARPDSVIHGPHRKAIAKWDEIGQTRKCVALGTLDIHAKKIPGVAFPKILPYEFVFGTIRTHILTREPLDKNDATAAGRQIYDAIEAGHCYLAHDGFGDSAGFQFTAQQRGRVVGIMGDEMTFSEGTRLVTALPEVAHICLLRDGVVVEEVDDKKLSYTVEKPGVYRIEARKKFRPWIFSNPIYVREA